MKQSIGTTVLLNIIIVFIVITFGFLSATLSYTKAFKVNSKIASSIEKFEGYNALSDREILQNLRTIGYKTAIDGTFKCGRRLHFSQGRLKTYEAIGSAGYKGHHYCIYKYDKKDGYVTYGIVTYIFMEVPLVGGYFKIPVYSETDAIYEFSA